MISLFYLKGNSQNVNHYFSYSTLTYTEQFKIDKEKLNPIIRLFFPSLSYKIEIERYGFEFFFVNSVDVYNSMSYKTPPPRDPLLNEINSKQYGLAFHYNLYNHKKLRINPHIGFHYNNYKEEYSSSWYQRFDTNYVPGMIGYVKREYRYGGLLGVNATYTPKKRFYFHSNIRFMYYPTSNLNKQSLVWELGVGYKFSHFVTSNKTEQ